MAFGDNGKRKKTMFEKLTLLIVLIMLVASLLGILQLQLVLSVIYKIDLRKFCDWDFPALF